MATSAPPAAPSLVAAPLPSGPGAAVAPVRFGAAPAPSFASLLDQLGQPLKVAAASPAPSLASDAPGATTPVLDPSPPATTPTPTAPLPAAPAPTATALPATTALGASKPAAKKLTPNALDAAEPPSVPTAAATPAPAPPPEPPLPPPAVPPPIPVASPATTPTIAVAAPKSSPLAELPNAPRMDVQAAAAAQAGLSVDDDRGDAAERPAQQPVAPREAAAANQPGAIPFPPMPAASPRFAGGASPVVPAEPGASLRMRALPPVRTAEPGAPAQPSSPSNAAGAPSQQAPSPAPDVQALLPTASPGAALIAAAPTASARPAQQTAPPPPSPAAQVAQAIVEPVKVVLTSPAQAGPATSHVTTIQITPAELGRVDVRIERTSDGPARIQLVAERPETLSRLVHDQSQLQQALDHVGIPQNSRTLEFSLAPATTSAGAFPSGSPGDTSTGGESSGNGSQRGSPSFYSQTSGESEGDLASATRSRQLRTGIDITA